MNHTKELISIKTDKDLKGSGQGSMWNYAISIEALNTFSYYYKMKNGGYHRETIDAQYTNIYEQEDCIPQVEKHKTLCKYRCPGLAKFLLFNNLKIVEIKNRWEYRRS